MFNVVRGGAIAICMLAGTASAEVVDYSEAPYLGEKGSSVFEDVAFVFGESASVSHLGNIDAGWYQLTLTDFAFPGTFDDLRVAISTASSLVSVLALEEGELQSSQFLQLADTDSYYLSIYGQSASSAYSLYGVELARFVASPIPLPPSLALLLTGMVAWGTSCIRRPKAGG